MKLLKADRAHHLAEEAAGDVGSGQTLARSAEIRLAQAGALQIHGEEPVMRNPLDQRGLHTNGR